MKTLVRNEQPIRTWRLQVGDQRVCATIVAASHTRTSAAKWHQIHLETMIDCKNRRPYNLYCVGADVKPCEINQSINND